MQTRVYANFFFEGDPCSTTYQDRRGKYQNQPEKVTLARSKMSNVELISLTPDAEKTMAYIARVSNPKNQKNEDYSKLLSYCIKNEHWSVFEQAFMTLQIETNRGIAAQILRHRSFTFQEFSQRYADSSQLGNIPIPDLRRQDF